MKTKTPKPRVMWAAYYNTPRTNPTLHLSNAEANDWTGVASTFRVAVIPLDDIEAIVERATLAFQTERSFGFPESIRAALTAAGIPCRKARK